MSSVELQDKVTATSDQHRALFAVSDAIASHRDLTALFAELASRLLRVVSFDSLSLVLHEPATNVMRLHVLVRCESPAPPFTMDLRPDDDPAGLVWQTQQPFIISKLSEWQRWPRLLERVQQYGMQSGCWLPLATARRRLGTLVFTSKQPATYDNADVRFLQLIANQVAVAVENALAFQEIETLKDKLVSEKAYLQSKLLRVLQEQEFERLGGTRTIKVNVRLVAATNCDLTRMVAQRQFRSDLYYRLNVFPLTLPPLRERLDDIPRLVRHFTQRFARRMRRHIETIPSSVMDALVRYRWPGNVRELQNVIERAVILSNGPALQVPMSDLQVVRAQTHAGAAPAPITLTDAEREHIMAALAATGWVVGGPRGAAARLGMKRSTLQKKMQKLGFSRPA